MSSDIFHTELAKAIESDTEYKSAADATAEANAKTGSLSSAMSCDITPNEAKHNNLGPTFTVDGSGTVEKIVSLINKGNKTGNWEAKVDSNWVTLSPGSDASITGETDKNSNTNLRVVYPISDTTLKPGESDSTTLTIKEDGKILCEQTYDVYRRWSKPAIADAFAMTESGSSEYLDMFPVFSSTINKYTINVEQDVQKIYLLSCPKKERHWRSEKTNMFVLLMFDTDFFSLFPLFLLFLPLLPLPSSEIKYENNIVMWHLL